MKTSEKFGIFEIGATVCAFVSRIIGFFGESLRGMSIITLLICIGFIALCIIICFSGFYFINKFEKKTIRDLNQLLSEIEKLKKSDNDGDDCKNEIEIKMAAYEYKKADRKYYKNISKTNLRNILIGFATLAVLIVFNVNTLFTFSQEIYQTASIVTVEPIPKPEPESDSTTDLSPKLEKDSVVEIALATTNPITDLPTKSNSEQSIISNLPTESSPDSESLTEQDNSVPESDVSAETTPDTKVELPTESSPDIPEAVPTLEPKSSAASGVETASEQVIETSPIAIVPNYNEYIEFKLEYPESYPQIEGEEFDNLCQLILYEGETNLNEKVKGRIAIWKNGYKENIPLEQDDTYLLEIESEFSSKNDKKLSSSLLDEVIEGKQASMDLYPNESLAWSLAKLYRIYALNYEYQSNDIKSILYLHMKSISYVQKSLDFEMNDEDRKERIDFIQLEYRNITDCKLLDNETRMIAYDIITAIDEVQNENDSK